MLQEPAERSDRMRQRPVGLPGGDPPTREQDCMSAHQLMGGRTRVHAGVMQNEILDLHELSRPPQRGAGVMKMGAQPKGFRDRAQRRRSSSRASASDAASRGACSLS